MPKKKKKQRVLLFIDFVTLLRHVTGQNNGFLIRFFVLANEVAYEKTLATRVFEFVFSREAGLVADPPGCNASCGITRDTA